MIALFGIIGFLVVPESYGPVLLQRRAKRIRYETRNWAIHAKADENEVNLREIATKYLTRPALMFVQEPILIAITIYLSLIYGIIYLFFEAFPIVFIEQRGWNMGVGSLPFIALNIGVIFGVFIIGVYTKTRFARIMAKTGKVVPEERLLPMIAGSLILPIGLLWFAWTDHLVSPWGQIIALVPIGMGLMLIFLQGLTYVSLTTSEHYSAITDMVDRSSTATSCTLRLLLLRTLSSEAG
jgi:MFS transporter, DHA1 family, multidrug resistance protein